MMCKSLMTIDLCGKRNKTTLKQKNLKKYKEIDVCVLHVSHNNFRPTRFYCDMMELLMKHSSSDGSAFLLLYKTEV